MLLICQCTLAKVLLFTYEIANYPPTEIYLLIARAVLMRREYYERQ